MPPTTGYDPIGTVQQAITALLTTNEPTFIALGARLFRSFAVILLAWYGIRWMLGAGDHGERVFGFARLLLVIAFGYAMITFYESPIPGFDTSFSNLITDQTAYLASTISARSIQDAQQTLSTLWNALEQPDPWSILAEPPLLDHAHRHRPRPVRDPLRRLLRHGRLRRLRPARSPLHPLLHRPHAGMALLELAQGLRPVLLHARRRQRLHLRLRALPQSLPAVAAARACASRTSSSTASTPS